MDEIIPDISLKTLDQYISDPEPYDSQITR